MKALVAAVAFLDAREVQEGQQQVAEQHQRLVDLPTRPFAGNEDDSPLHHSPLEQLEP